MYCRCCSAIEFRSPFHTFHTFTECTPSHPFIPQADDFDEGVQYQLIQKRSEEEAVAALRWGIGDKAWGLGENKAVATLNYSSEVRGLGSLLVRW